MASRIAPVSLEYSSPRKLPPLSSSRATSEAFQALLGKLTETLSVVKPGSSQAQVYTVRQGDNLSQICQKAMSQQGFSTSLQDISRAVAVVAKANNIANPDVIHVGQSLDLRSLLSFKRGEGGPAGAKAFLPTPGPSGQLTRLIQSLSSVAASEKKGQAQGGQPWQSMLETPAEITSGYGTRKDPFTGRIDYHSGVDFAASQGTAVHPWKSGTVKFSGWQPEYGKIVIVAHDDGTETAYAHNSKNLVKAGQSVEAGTRIALLGSTGRSTGPHLHFELRQNGQTIDPTVLLKDGSFQIAKAL